MIDEIDSEFEILVDEIRIEYNEGSKFVSVSGDEEDNEISSS